jgi:hypothetical protein
MIRQGILLCSLVVLVGCNGATRVDAPPFDVKAAVEKAFADYDSNHDGMLDAQELERCPSLKSALGRIDKNNDKRINREELQEEFTTYEKSRVGLMEIVLRVMQDEKPVAGATIELEPEKFMGPKISPATGTTDEAGRARMKKQGSDQFGVHFGCYKVRISKKDANGRELIPARYNTESKLGFEAAPAGLGSNGGVFRLSAR